MMRLIKFLLSPFTDNKGDLSIRRLMAVYFAIGCMRYVEQTYNCSRDVNENVLWTFGLIICILLGIATVQNVLDKFIDNKKA